jgi:hypothetical protein
MRWLVEVTSLGKTDTEALHVEAESWQKALQAARGQRGESAPMSGFSIELLDEGCRAIDPMSRLRYEVRRAPEEGTTTRAPSVRPPPAAAAVSRPRSVSQAPRPVSSQPPPSAQPSQPPPSNASQPPPSSNASQAQHPSRRPPISAASMSAIGAASGGPLGATPAPPAAAAPIPVAPAVTTGAAPWAPRSDVGAHVVPSQVIFKREHDATDSVPLTYREYVFLVPTGTSEAAAEALLQTQLELVLASLARVPAGKLVNLGVFDVSFQGKPPVPPLATMMWKDWRGAPAVEFPRRPGYVPHASAPPPAPAIVAQPPPAVSPVSPPPDPIAHVASAAPPAAIPVAPTAVPVAVEPAPAPIAVATPAVTMTVPAEAIAPPQPAAAPQPRARVRGEDLIADLFESMHDLHFLRDAVEGGDFCLSLALEKIPSQAGLVHLYDIDRREFLITSTRGVAASTLLLRRHDEGDVMLSAAMGKRRALVVADATQSEEASLDRYVVLGGARSLVVAPVMLSGRFLGAIELLNPLDGQPYTEADGNALTYIAEQFAEFVASRGVVTDPERISSRMG